MDRTELVGTVVPGGVLRSTSTEVTAGGKGVNVARVLRAFGHHPPIVGLVAEHDGDQLEHLLAEEGASVVAVRAPGRVRQAIIMIEQVARRVTVLNESGTELPAAVWAEYRAAVRSRLAGQRLLVCSGSLPPGAPLDGYGQLVELAEAAGVLSVVDTAPGPLAATLSYHPDLVTPNLEEAEAALAGDTGLVLHTGDQSDADIRERAARAASALVERGARRAAVTAGDRGVAFAGEPPSGTSGGAPAGTASGAGTTSGAVSAHGVAHPVVWLPAVPVDVVSAVGAGDSFVGGLALALLEMDGLSAARPPNPAQWLAALRRATATAAASCEQVRAGGVRPARVAELLARVGTAQELAVHGVGTADGWSAAR
jgi:fructose-1-phosphate kinase PfkB-like protein